MKIILDFFSDLINTLIMDDSISDCNIGEATGKFLKIAFTTFIVIVIFSLMTLMTNEGFDSVLLSANQEFLQLTGLKLFSYSMLLLVPLGFIFYSCNFLTRLIAFFVKSIANIGFVITATLAGALLGMIFAEFFIFKSPSSLLTILHLYFLILLLTTLFYGSPKLFSKEARDKIDDFFNGYTVIVALILGIIFFSFVVYGFNNELWIEVNKK